MKIKLPFVEFEYDNGNWFWKAASPKPIPRKASETPQFDVIDTIERVNKKEFDKALSNASRDIVRYLV